MATPCDKDLFDIISTVSVPIIALIAAYIAWQQRKINQHRLRHELFDRNFKVYEAILRFIGSVVTSGKVKDENLYNFYKETRAAKFLLGKDIANFVSEIYNKAVDLQTLEAELEGLPVGDERSRIVRERGEIKKWIYRQFGELDKKFENSLALREEPSIYHRLRHSSRRQKQRS